MLKITDIPFYKAEQLFTEGKYDIALPIMISCVMQGNIYAAHYLDYAIKNSLLQIALPIELQEYVKTKFPQYFQTIPKDFHSDVWLKTTLIHQKILTSTTKKTENLYTPLISLASYCTKAYILLKEFIFSSGSKKLQLPAVQVLDLYHVLSNREQSAYTEIEHKAMEAYKSLADRSGAQLERIIARIWGGQAPLNGEKLIYTSIDRMRGWTIAGACMGNHNLQFTFAVDKKVGNSEEEKYYWTITAAYNGNLIAQAIAVNIYFVGNKYIKRNTDLAGMFARNISDDLSTLAIPQGSEKYIASALCTKGYLYEQGLGNCAKSDIKALQCYQNAATLNDVLGCFNLAVFYEHGKGGIEKNFLVACNYYEKSIQLGNVEALEIAAQLYFFGGHGLLKDEHKAGTYLLKYLAERGELSDKSKICFAILQLKGSGNVKQNQQEAVTTLYQLVLSNDTKAAYYLLNAYLNKILVVSYPELSPFFIEKLFLQVLPEYPELYSVCGVFYFENIVLPDYKMKAYKAFKKGVELKQIDAFYNMGILYEQGCQKLGIESNPTIAYEYYEKAAVLGHPSAMNNQGFFLMTGLLGIEPDKAARAKLILEEALRGGVTIAAYNLACWYYRYGTKADYELMLAYMHQAEATQDPDVLQELGLYYANGIGTEKDFAKAAHYFKLATIQGSAVSACSLTLLAISIIMLQQKVIFTSEFIQTCLASIERPVTQQLPEAILLKAILVLLQDNSKKEQTLKLLSEASSLPFGSNYQNKIIFALRYINDKDKITPLELIGLLSANVNSFQDMQ